MAIERKKTGNKEALGKKALVVTETRLTAQEAVTKEKQDLKPIWKKVTKGVIYPFPTKKNKRVKVNETIQVSEKEIAHVREHFQLIKDGTGEFAVDATAPESQSEESSSLKKDTFTIVPADNGEGHNVVSPAGKVINTEPLAIRDAEELKEQLEETTEED